MTTEAFDQAVLHVRPAGMCVMFEAENGPRHVRYALALRSMQGLIVRALVKRLMEAVACR